jgi:hypothetical protein
MLSTLLLLQGCAWVKATQEAGAAKRKAAEAAEADKATETDEAAETDEKDEGTPPDQSPPRKSGESKAVSQCKDDCHTWDKKQECLGPCDRQYNACSDEAPAASRIEYQMQKCEPKRAKCKEHCRTLEADCETQCEASQR